MGSSIPAARLNLYTALRDAPALADPVQVAFGVPVGYQAREIVTLLGVDNVDTDDKLLGQSGPLREETYAIIVHVQTWDQSASEADVPALDARLWALYDAVRDVVKASRNLNGALTNGWARVGTADPEESPAPAIDDSGRQQGWVAWTRCRVLCRARIE